MLGIYDPLFWKGNMAGAIEYTAEGDDMKRLKVILMVILGMSFSAAAYSEENDHLIIPGQRIGWMHIGMNFDRILQSFGYDYEKTENEYFYIYEYQKYMLEFVIDKSDNTIYSIISKNSNYYLSTGIRIGSSEKKVISTYGNPEKVVNNTRVLGSNVLVYHAMGIHFLISDHVWGIGIEQKTPPAY
jgi:hypothetical protein